MQDLKNPEQIYVERHNELQPYLGYYTSKLKSLITFDLETTQEDYELLKGLLKKQAREQARAQAPENDIEVTDAEIVCEYPEEEETNPRYRTGLEPYERAMAQRVALREAVRIATNYALAPPLMTYLRYVLKATER